MRRRRTPDERLDALFHALSDRTRRRMLAALVIRPSMVTELARPFDMSLPAVSKHLRILEAAGLVRRTIDGRIHRCRIEAEPLRAVELWLDPFRSYWEVQLQDLARALELPRPAPRGRRTGAARRP
jgi:DNA-binding transcriptional ArsR family regulator